MQAKNREYYRGLRFWTKYSGVQPLDNPEIAKSQSRKNPTSSRRSFPELEIKAELQALQSEKDQTQTMAERLEDYFAPAL